MKTIFFLLSAFIFNITLSQEATVDKIIFANSGMTGNHFYSSASYKSPGWVKNLQHKLPVNEKTFFTPGNSLELKYVSAPGGSWRAELYYNPVRGLDSFNRADQLVFKLYVNSVTKADELPEVAVGKIKKGYSSFLPLRDFISGFQTGEWLTVKIPLNKFSDSCYHSVENINAIAFQQQSEDGKEHQLFIDQVELVPERNYDALTGSPRIISATGYEKHIDIKWEKITDSRVKYVKIYRSTDNRNFHPVGIQNTKISRYADFIDNPGGKFYYKISLLDKNYHESKFSGTVSAAARPMTDKQLMDMVQRASFRYYWEGAEPNSGMALECIPGRPHMVATGASGFGMMALIAGTERGFITRDQLAERFDKITRFLEKAETFHGAFPHFIDGRTGEVVTFFGERDNGGDLVETAFLVQGLLAARQYFDGDNKQEKTIRERITRIWEGIEWDWYRQEEDSKYLTWHWSPDRDWVIDHQLIGWNETMITYILGISSPTHSIPASMYYTGWAGQGKKAQNYRKGWGKTEEGSQYANGNTYHGIPLEVGVSKGGPLFFTHYSFMGLDPHRMLDAYTNYFDNNRDIALINYRYCLENPNKHEGYGPDCWGLTASDGPWNYSPDEPRATRDDGKITPTGAIASFPYTPDKSMNALTNYYRNYGRFLWGAYGFRDAFNLGKNWRSEIYMGLNQAPMAVMIENYRSGFLWDLFMSNEDVQSGLKKIGHEHPKNNYNE
jgi:hypothetical protein